MVEKVKRNMALKNAISLVSSCSVKGYLQCSGKEKKERIYNEADRLLSDENLSKRKQFCLFMEEDNSKLLHSTPKTIAAEDREKFAFAVDLYRIVQPLFIKHEKYLQTGLPKGFGECSLDNEKAVQFVLESKYERLAYCISYKIIFFEVVNLRDSNNPILSEHLYTCCMKSQRPHPSFVKYRKVLIYIAQSVRRHIEIGKLLGLDHYSQAVYDVLTGSFRTAFDAQYVCAAKELSDWIYNTPHKPLPSHIDFAREIVQKANELKDKYLITDDWEEDIYSYLINELLVDFYPEEDEQIDPDDLDEDCLSLSEEDEEG